MENLTQRIKSDERDRLIEDVVRSETGDSTTRSKRKRYTGNQKDFHWVVCDVLLVIIAAIDMAFLLWTIYAIQFPTMSPTLVWICVFWGVMLLCSVIVLWISWSSFSALYANSGFPEKVKWRLTWLIFLTCWTGYFFIVQFVGQPIDASITSNGWSQMLGVHRNGLFTIPMVLINFL